MNKTVTEIWNRRSLILTLAISDLKLRYRNSIFGFFWSFLEPLLMLTVLYLVFTEIFHSTIQYYPLYLLMGLIMWNMFARGTSIGMESILNKSGLITQTYLPREVVVFSGVLTSFFMMLFELIVFFIFMGVFGLMPPVTIIMLPLMVVILFVLTLGFSFVLSSLLVYYRDLRSIWNVILQAAFFAATIIYQITIFPEKIRHIISLNPIVPLLDISRNVTIYNKWPDGSDLAYLISVTFIMLCVGYVIFKILDRRIVEEL